MASGDIVGIIGDIVPPATTYATFDTRSGGSTPAEGLPVYDFDDTTIEYLDVYCRLEGYDGGGLTVTWDWSATSATTGSIVASAAIRALPDDAEDIDSAHSYDYNDTTDACASASGEPSRVSIAFTSGADMDNLADTQSFILRLRRNTSSGSDDMVGDAEYWLFSLCIKET